MKLPVQFGRKEGSTAKSTLMGLLMSATARKSLKQVFDQTVLPCPAAPAHPARPCEVLPAPCDCLAPATETSVESRGASPVVSREGSSQLPAGSEVPRHCVEHPSSR